VQHVDVAEAAARLRAEAHDGVAGHRQVALVRRGPVSLILFLFEAGASLREHRADGEVTIQVLAGRLSVSAAGEAFDLGPGELVSLAPGHPHAVQALEESTMLLSICRIPAEHKAD
jgi:quercetin dioxygenase-like cupin family protein